MEIDFFHLGVYCTVLRNKHIQRIFLCFVTSIYTGCPALGSGKLILHLHSYGPWKVENKEQSFCMFSLLKELQTI